MMPCLLAVFGLFAPRLAFLCLWLFTPLTKQAFNTWIFPLLGIIFLPHTTLFYCLVAAPLGPTNFWGWIIVVLGLLMDLRGVSDARTGYDNRDSISTVGQNLGTTNRV